MTPQTPSTFPLHDDDIDRLGAELASEAFGKLVESMPGRHFQETDECPSLFRFVESKNVWSAAEEAHVAACPLCQKRLVMAARVAEGTEPVPSMNELWQSLAESENILLASEVQASFLPRRQSRHALATNSARTAVRPGHDWSRVSENRKVELVIGHRDGGLCEIICRLNEELSEPVLMRIELNSADGASRVVRFLVVAPVRRTIAAGSTQIGSDDVPIGVASDSDEESFSVILERVPTDSLGVTVQDAIEDEGALSSLLAAVTALGDSSQLATAETLARILGEGDESECICVVTAIRQSGRSPLTIRLQKALEQTRDRSTSTLRELASKALECLSETM